MEKSGKKEYMIKCYKDFEEAEEELNEWAENGWELEHVFVENFLFITNITHYYSRPKKE